MLAKYVQIDYNSAVEGKDVGFRYEIVSFSDNEITFQLLFDDARQVSNSIDNDGL